jgi:predicted DNA-binding protein (MmcQ/YjbR family)
MELPDVVEQCLSFPGAEETQPFGPEALVYKVGGKMFAVTSPDEFPARINLKCDPERAVELRDEHPGIKSGWHMNKKHWNTVMLDGTVPPKLVRELVEHSYQLVVDALPKKVREGIKKKG